MLIKIVVIIALISILYQDLRERAVYWFVFPIFIICSGYLHFIQTETFWFLKLVGINLALLSIILGIAMLYSKYKMKKNFLKESFGIGDLLFYVGLAVAFPTFSFVIIFVFSLIFSLVIQLAVVKNNPTVPLAGFASLFLIFIYFSHWFGIYNNLYLY